MRQLKDMSIMEIDITNACHKTCSNCTRFCGHHKKPYFMNFETFKRAVDSLDGFEGLISTIGGEPLLHPEYSRFADYLCDVRGKPKLMEGSRGNIISRNYLVYAKTQRWAEASVNRGRGYLLFTSIPSNYYKNYEDVQATVSDLWLNDHSNPSMHQPILISRKDLGIDDEEFAKLRDNCWLQSFWSGSVTPKGCFFCEIAGTLDMLFDGPGGKAIESGWWKKDVSEFSDQFRWCDICGMALSTFSRNANDEIDDASPTLYTKLDEVGSLKFKNNKVLLVKSIEKAKFENNSLGADMASVMGNYQPVNEKRVKDLKENMRPRNIIELPSLGLDAAKAVKTRETGICRDWLLYKETGMELPNNFERLIKERYLNPGYLFLCKFGENRAVLFSPMALAVKQIGFDGLRDCVTINDLVEKWGNKTYILESGFEKLPDIDIPYCREKVFSDYDSDTEFKERLCIQLKQYNVNSGANILVLQSAFVFHTLSITQILENMGFNVYVLSNEKFREFFEDWLPSERVMYFAESHFKYIEQKNIKERLYNAVEFGGAVVPFSFGSSTVKFIDDYTGALKTAVNIGSRILGIINIRRKFIETEYDIWEEKND